MRILIFLLFIVNASLGQESRSLEKAQDLYDKGKEYYYDGEYEKAEITFDSCLLIRSNLLESPHELLMDAYRRLGNTNMRLRDFDEGEKYLMKFAEEAEALKGPKSAEVAGAYMDIARLENTRHRYSKSMEWNEKSIAIRSEIYGPHSKEVAYVRMNNAINYNETGNFVKCINEYEKVLKIYDRALDPDDENYNRVYLTLSTAYRKKGDLNNSLLYAEKALEIKLKNYKSDHPSVAKYYAVVAKAQASLYQLEKSKESFKKAAESIKHHGSDEDIVSIENDAARILLKSDDFSSAKEIFIRSSQFFPPGVRKHYIALENIALCEYYLGNREEAIRIQAEVKKHNPDVDGYLKLSEWTREAGRADDAAKYLALAKEYANEGDALTAVKILFEQASQAATHDLEKAWNDINSAILELTKMRRKYLGSASKQFINESLVDIFDLAVNVAVLRYEKTNENAKLADLYKVVEMAKAASYWDNLSEENAGFLGKVPAETLEEIELLKREGESRYLELEAKLSELEEQYPEYYKAKYTLDVPDVQNIQEVLSPEIAIFDYYVLDSTIVALMINHSELQLITYPNLGQIDFKQEHQLIQGGAISRISISPHEFIHYESFERLVNPRTGKYFLYDYAFSYQINLHSFLSNDEGNVSENNYLGFVPEFKVTGSSELQALRSQLVPLPSAIKEIEEASKFFKGTVYSGDDAVENRFYEEAPKYDFIHFATHAQIDPTNELNSFLYLNSNDEEQDGILYADEIMETEINADLVILSACETGNGGIKTGEGVMSLSRAFQYAGAKSVLMSLWRANDQSARPIIVEFIENYKKGMPKDVALQQSKLSYLEKADPLMRDDFYWAGFMVNGDLSGGEQNRRRQLFFILGALTVAILGFVFFRGREVGSKDN